MNQLDYAVIGFYLLGVACLGFFIGRREKNSQDFFLAGRSMPWWAVCVSIMATEISAVTFIGVPEAGFRGNYQYLQFAFGSFIGRYLIAYVLLPSFFKEEIDTIYGFLKNRFGSRSHILSCIFFFITRIMASGVRLYAASLALSVATNLSLGQSLAVAVGITAIYTTVGGLKAVMGTDILQFTVFFGGALIALATLVMSIPGGFATIFREVLMHEQTTGIDKMQVFNFGLNISDPETLLVSILFGCFMTFAALGADQDLAQRLLSCKRLKESQRAITLTGYITFPVVGLFLFIGTALFVYFKVHPELPMPESSAKIFPFYIVHFLPHGLLGLLIVGLLASAMSSLDSAMNALASSAVLDIYKPYLRPTATEKELLLVSRVCIVCFALCLVGFALLCHGRDQILFLGFKLVSFTYGALLGIFCLGILTRRGSDAGNVCAMIFSTALLVGLYVGQNALVAQGIWDKPWIAWSWFVIIGTVTTFGVGSLFPARQTSRA